jgi:hypothetical protein
MSQLTRRCYATTYNNKGSSASHASSRGRLSHKSLRLGLVSLAADSRLGLLLAQRQSHSYFTTSDLPPISPSSHQAPWGSRPEISFQLNPCDHSPYVTSSLKRRRVCLLWTGFAFVKCTYRIYSIGLEFLFNFLIIFTNWLFSISLPNS